MTARVHRQHRVVRRQRGPAHAELGGERVGAAAPAPGEEDADGGDRREVPLPPGVPNPLPESFFETAADVFSSTFTISVVLIVLTLIPAFFLPRKKIASPLTEEDMDRGPIMMH